MPASVTTFLWIQIETYGPNYPVVVLLRFAVAFVVDEVNGRLSGGSASSARGPWPV